MHIWFDIKEIVDIFLLIYNIIIETNLHRNDENTVNCKTAVFLLPYTLRNVFGFVK